MRNNNNDKLRLIKLLDSHQITESEYLLLIQALDKEPKLITRIFQFIINPYEKLSPILSLIVSILIVLLLSYLCYITNFLGQWNKFSDTEKISYFSVAKFPLTMWISTSVIFLLVSLILGARKLRMLDFFAFCGIALFPFFMIILLDSIAYSINPKFINPGNNEDSYILIYSGILDTIAILLLFWYIVSNFFAFKISSGLNQHRSWLGFVIAMIIANTIITVWLVPAK